MVLEKLVQFHNDLTKFDPSVPIAVQYFKDKGLVFRQLGKLINVTYMNVMFFPKPSLKLGVLTPNGYAELMESLQKLIQDPDLSKGELSTTLKSYGFDVYKCYDRSVLSGPQLYVKIRFTTFTSYLLSTLVLRNYNPETRTLLKALKNELKSK